MNVVQAEAESILIGRAPVDYAKPCLLIRRAGQRSEKRRKKRIDSRALRRRGWRRSRSTSPPCRICSRAGNILIDDAGH